MKDYFLNHPTNKLDKNSTNQILKTSKSIFFHKSFYEYKKSPLIELSVLAKDLNITSLYVKDESFRFGLNAFKVLGASYAN